MQSRIGQVVYSLSQSDHYNVYFLAILDTLKVYWLIDMAFNMRSHEKRNMTFTVHNTIVFYLIQREKINLSKGCLLVIHNTEQ